LDDTTYELFTNRQGDFHALFTAEIQIAAQIFRQTPNPSKERRMATNATFTMKLTPEQKNEIRKVTGKDAEVLELSVEELEERIAPMSRKVIR
jgi:hypothetical protein